MIKNISIILLFVIGILYSFYLSLQGGLFLGIVFVLITIGISYTIYVLNKKTDYRIIIYVWIAIVTITVVIFISVGVFRMAELFKNPLKFL